MPVDNRRNQGPEKTESYRLFIPKSTEYGSKKALNSNGSRTDGRGFTDLRKIYLKTGVVTQAKGSAYVEMGVTKVLVSVFEPREIPRLSEFTPNGELYCELKFAPFSCVERKGHVMDGEEKDLSVILKRALEPTVCRHEFPNFQVDIYALVLDNDGSCLSAAITAAGLALADASIPMYDVLASVTLGVHGNHVLIDPNYEEECLCKTAVPLDQGGMGYISITLMPTLSQMTELTQVGCMSMDRILSSLDILTERATELSVAVKQCLIEDVKNKVKQMSS